MNNSGVSVFFPCINEEGNIENIVGRAEEVLRKLRVKYEIIIIDDGSSDQTGQIADKLSRENSNIRVIHHSQNLGYGEALKSGFYNARYNIIVYTDGDGQFDFSEVTKFLGGVNKAVYGINPFSELERSGGEETESSVDAVVGVVVGVVVGGFCSSRY